MKKILTIIDFNRTIFDPETKTFFKDARLVLEKLKEKKSVIILISQKEDSRAKALRENGLDELFEEIHFVEEKTTTLFKGLVEKYKPDQTFVVGDYLPAEIRIGNIIGAETIWLASGKFSFFKPKEKMEIPKHTVKQLIDILPIIN